MIPSLPVVLVEIAPADPPAHLAKALLSACSQALRGADCVLADGAEGRNAWGIAVVSWRDEQETRAWVQVGQRGAERDDWRSRQVRFVSADTRQERWRTIGFTVATLVGESDQALRGPSNGDQPGPAGPAPLASTAERDSGSTPDQSATDDQPGSTDPASVPAWLELGVLTGTGLEDGPWRGGVQARTTVAPTRLPLLATGSAHWTTRLANDELSAQWAGFTVGLGGVARLPVLRLDLSAELLFERLRVSFSEAGTGAEDSGSQWSSGLLGRVTAAWPPDGPLGVVAGVQAWRQSRPTSVLVRDAHVGTWPTSGWGLTLGAEWRIP